MADLDEISMMLGEIKSDLKHALHWFNEHEEKDQERFEKLAERIEVHNGVKARVDSMESTLKDHKPIIEQVRRVKWLGAITASIVVTLSAIGANFATLFQGWFNEY